jgi:Tfp pilus assembly protein PilX
MDTPLARSRREAGSAYLITLLALVLLTVIALSLTLVTRTEVQMGANERTINRTFYAAESGLGVAAAQALASGRYTGRTVVLNATNEGGLRVADRVEVAPMAPILTVRCDWCPANDDGVPEFWKVHHAATATAQRVAWNGTPDPPADARVLGEKTLSVMLEFQPWPTPPTDAVASVEELRKVKF